jgi:excisionase family DNA binding protein
MNEFDLPTVLTVDEAAAALRVSPESVRRWLRDGGMLGVKFGHTWRVSRGEVLRVLSEGVESKPVALAGGRVHPGADGSLRAAETRQAGGRGSPLVARIVG